ncbi:MAG: hypothetical protein HUJ25_16180 [Crocinitomicaceae bacterium]|nr:hypothetical protein [Crocinitomicaceae bacterium]
MRYFLVYIITVICFSGFGQSNEENTRPLRYFESGTMFYDRIFPACSDYNAAGVPNFNSFGLEGEFLAYTFGQWRWKQMVSGLFAGKEVPDLVENIEFQGGYLGGFSAWTKRFSGSIGSVMAFQPHPKLEIGLPVMFTVRLTKQHGYFYAYEGQGIDPEDEVSPELANTANSMLISKKWMPGFKTGLEVVGFPNSIFSVVGRINYQYFGWRDVVDLSTAKLNASAGTVDFTSDRVWSTPEWGFSLGVRFYFVTVREHDTKTKRDPDKKDGKVILTPEKRQ